MYSSVHTAHLLIKKFVTILLCSKGCQLTRILKPSLTISPSLPPLSLFLTLSSIPPSPSTTLSLHPFPLPLSPPPRSLSLSHPRLLEEGWRQRVLPTPWSLNVLFFPQTLRMGLGRHTLFRTLSGRLTWRARYLSPWSYQPSLCLISFAPSRSHLDHR